MLAAKKIVLLILIICISLFSFATFANAQDNMESNDLKTKPPTSVFADTLQCIIMQIDNPYMSINGTLKEIDPGYGAAPKIINDRTMIPIRALIDQLGGEVQWIDNENKVIIHLYAQVIELYINQPKAYINKEEKKLDVVPVIISERTYLPLRFVAEASKCSVEWNEDYQYVKIAPNETYVSTFKELDAILDMRVFRWGGSGFNKEYSNILNNIRLNTGNDFEQGLYKLLENDMEGCYFCGIFLIVKDYLYGSEPLPDITLKVFDIGLSLPIQDDDDKYTRVSLSIVAAIANKKYGEEEKAKSLKIQAEEMMQEDPNLRGAFPALDETDRAIYDSL